MTQSGSTAGWNLVKFILDEIGIDYDYGFIPTDVNIDKKTEPPKLNINDFNKKRNNLSKPLVVKIHRKSYIEIKDSDLVILSIRNLQQATISGRKKGHWDSKNHIHNNIEIYNEWKDRSDHIIKFNNLVNNTDKVIDNVCSKLGIKLTKNQKNNIVNKVKNIPTNDYKKYLLTSKHIQSKGTYHHDISLPNDILRELNNHKEKYKELFV